MKKMITFLVGCGMAWYNFSGIFSDFSFNRLLWGLLGIALILLSVLVLAIENASQESEEDQEKRELDEAAKKRAWYEARKEAYKKEYKDQMQ